MEATGKTHRFSVKFERQVVIDVDEALTPDDEWRDVFYDFHSLDNMAQHIVYNWLCGFRQIEGIVDEDHDKFTIVDRGYFEPVETYELLEEE